MTKKGQLVVFLRAPQLGMVKSRLGRTIGLSGARQVYTEITRTVLRRVGGDARWRTWLAVTPNRWANRGRFWRGRQARVPLGRIAQGHGDLGQRMARALAAFPARPVIIIGSDIPGIRGDHIDHAFAALGRCDVVFGPASDGGYWLVGVRPGVSAAHLFDNVRWSGPHALADTIANVPSRQQYLLLETLEDIDDASDLARWRNG